MAYREFFDSDGQAWRVWSTVPVAGSRLRGGFDQGWLTFECTTPNVDHPLRRLCPIPPDWETAPENRLDLMCRAAVEVERPSRARAQPEAPEASETAGELEA